MEKFHLGKPQNYIPIYQRFFSLNETNFNGLNLNNKWYINNNGYVYGRSSNGHCSLHKTVLLMNNKIIDKDVIDHINRNKLDNRLENLKTVTFQENSRNRTSSINSSVSKYVGVTKRENNKYRSRIEINKKSISLGSFNTAEEAARARDKYVIEQFGVDSCYTLNFPNEY